MRPGVKHVVASCGTALTENQVRAMKRHSEHVVVNFDPDTAGANATEKSIKTLLDEGMHIRILELEGGLDPDEYVRKNGAEMYSARLERATGYFLWLADRARRKFDMTSAEGQCRRFREHAASCDSEDFRQARARRGGWRGRGVSGRRPIAGFEGISQHAGRHANECPATATEAGKFHNEREGSGDGLCCSMEKYGRRYCRRSQSQKQQGGSHSGLSIEVMTRLDG